MPQEFVFNDVVTLKPYLFIVIGISVLFPVMAVITEALAPDIPGSKLWGAIAGFAAMGLVFKALSKTVTISFTAQQVIFKINEKQYTYAKVAIQGFYRYNYQQTQNSTIAFDFLLTHGSRITISDYEFSASKYNAAKHQRLQNFRTTAQQQLRFHAVTSHANTIGNKKNWFSGIKKADLGKSFRAPNGSCISLAYL